MSFRYFKKATSDALKVIALYACYQFVVWYLKELYIIISQNQSGFKRGDSCINQLISITHDILNSLDEGLEVRGVFLDISKAFHKVWHNGLIYKLQ